MIHVHSSNIINKYIFSVFIRYFSPTKTCTYFTYLIRIEVGKTLIFTYRHYHIRNYCSITYALSYLLRSYIYMPSQFHYRIHTSRLLLPIKQINLFIIRRINRIIYQYFRLFSLRKHIVIPFNTMLCSEHQSPWMIFIYAQ